MVAFIGVIYLICGLIAAYIVAEVVQARTKQRLPLWTAAIITLTGPFGVVLLLVATPVAMFWDYYHRKEDE